MSTRVHTYILCTKMKYRYLAKKESFQAIMLRHLSTAIVLTHEVANWGGESTFFRALSSPFVRTYPILVPYM